MRSEVRASYPDAMESLLLTLVSKKYFRHVYTSYTKLVVWRWIGKDIVHTPWIVLGEILVDRCKLVARDIDIVFHFLKRESESLEVLHLSGFSNC